MTSPLPDCTLSHGVGSCAAIGKLEMTVAQLENYGNGAESQILLFPGEEVRVGRDADICSHVLSNPVVSSQHFRIYSVLYEGVDTSQLPPLLYCEDLQSLNGTWINDSLIGSYDMPRSGHLLNNGDKISIRPSWSFTFYQETMIPPMKLTTIQVQEMKIFEDRYKITDRLLGQGSHGTVYLARDAATKSQLACKIVDLQPWLDNTNGMQRNLRPACASFGDEPIREHERLLNEIDILRRLNHPNIVSLQKAFRSAHSLYMFTELAPGGDLFSFATAHGHGLEDIHARIITRQIAIAVKYIHSKGIVHRDLKPENILVMNTAIGHRVVLTDFGSSACVADKRRRMMSIVGTEAYAAPEVYFNEEPYTKAVDMWSLGVIAFCLLTGSTLFPQDAPQRLHLSQCDVDARIAEAKDNRYTNQSPQSMSNNAEGFIRSLLRIDAKNRLTSVQAVGHSWFQMPVWESREIEMLYGRAVSQRWSPRKESGNDIVEDLPDVSAYVNNRKSTENAKGSLRDGKRRITDCTTSAYFGLSNRLADPKEGRLVAKANQKRTLHSLHESGSQFLRYGIVPNRRQQSRCSAISIVEVDARNLFASTPIEIAAAEAANAEFNTFKQSILASVEVDVKSEPSSVGRLLGAAEDSGSIDLQDENQRKAHPYLNEGAFQEPNGCLIMPDMLCSDAKRRTSNGESMGGCEKQSTPGSSPRHGGKNRPASLLKSTTLGEIGGGEKITALPMLESAKAYAQRLAEVSVERAKLRESTLSGLLTDWDL